MMQGAQKQFYLMPFYLFLEVNFIFTIGLLNFILGHISLLSYWHFT